MTNDKDIVAFCIERPPCRVSHWDGVKSLTGLESEGGNSGYFLALNEG